MKKMFSILIFFLLLSNCTSNQTPSVTSNGITLDQALLEASDRIDERITKGIKIAMINFSSSSEQLSEYVLDELSANLVDSKNLIVIDRQDIDFMRKELNFQFSGEVDDNSIQEIGRTLGAEVIVTGSLRRIDNKYRIMIRVLSVESGTVDVQYRADINNDSRVASLLINSAVSNRTASSSNYGGQQGGSQTPERSVEIDNQVSTSAATMPLTNTSTTVVSQPVQVQQKPQDQIRSGLYTDGVFQRAMGLMDAIDWIALNAKNGGNYIIVLNRDDRASGIRLNFNNMQVNIILKSAGSEVTIRYDVSRPPSSLITVGQGVTFVLEDGIALVGLERDSKPLVFVSGGTFVMNGGIIRDNNSIEGAGVYLDKGEFIMNNGTVSGNRTAHGKDGGGIHLINGSFTMNGGTIRGNSTFYGNGGGIAVINSTFIMNGGTISGNSARGGYGGGIFLRGSSTFQKSGTDGIIYGSNASEEQVNKADDGGNAVFIRAAGGNSFKRNTTARVSQSLDSSQRGAAGGWE